MSVGRRGSGRRELLARRRVSNNGNESLIASRFNCTCLFADVVDVIVAAAATVAAAAAAA